MTPGATRHGLVLVVDDEDAVRRSMAEILVDEGYEVLEAESGEKGVEVALARAPDAIFLDVWLPGIDGIETLRSMRERGVGVPVIMISGHGTIETAVRATKRGAYDFVEKPLALERVLLVLRNAMRQAQLEKQHRALQLELRREAEFIGRGSAVESLRTALAAAADGRPVLLWGERGSGRSLAARWLSLHGPFPEGPFLEVRAGTLSAERILRSLYGDHEHRADDPGRLALADEGTLYLENLESLPPAAQESLATGIRTGSFPIPGASGVVRSEPVIVASLPASPDDPTIGSALLAALRGSFPHVIAVPSLRERAEDLPELAQAFLGRISREYARSAPTLALDALHALARHPWPGNVHELRRIIERLVLADGAAVIHAADLPGEFLAGRETAPPAQRAAGELEAVWLRRHLDEVRGDLARAAARLGLSQDELRARLDTLGLVP